MTQPVLQNFSVPADSDEDIVLTITTTIVGDTLDGATVYWRVYEQHFAIVDPDVPPVIEKSSLSGGGIDILPSPPMTVRITVTKTDTALLLRNYYHEVTVIAVDGSQYPPTCGIMTVTATENRVP